MKILLNILVLFLGLNILNAGPVVKLNKLSVEFTPVKQGSFLKDNTIIARNTGDKNLEIKLQSSCDCLIVRPDKNLLKPGGQTSLKLSFDTGSYKGKVKKYFYLITNDPKHETVRLSLAADIIPMSKPEKENTAFYPKVTAGSQKPLVFYYFYSSDCNECHKVKNKLFPEIEQRYNISLNPSFMDIVESANMEKLLKVKNYLKQKDGRFPVIVFNNEYLAGFKRIYAEFPSLVNKNKDKKNTLIDINKLGAKPLVISVGFFSVLLAGLVDGINPCAFATIIFLISYLNYLHKTRKMILLMGVFYTSSVFITYLFIGLGFLKGLTSLPWFHKISYIINILIALFTFFLAYLSLRDYFLARRGKYREMFLQLPDSFKKHIHKNIRVRSKSRAIILSVILMGFTIALIELACTGQIYLPTILILTKMGNGTGYLLLLLYNLMFIVPLAAVFTLFYKGIASEKMGKVFTKNLPLIKLSMFFLFVLLGILLIVIRA